MCSAGVSEAVPVLLEAPVRVGVVVGVPLQRKMFR